MTARLGGSVGRRAANAPDDVKTVQTLLQRHGRWLIPLRRLEATGICDSLTIASIERFQLRAAALLNPDGVVSPAGYTIKALNRLVIEDPRHGLFDPHYWLPTKGGLTAADFAAAAKALACEAAAIEAVAITETKRSPWDDRGRPTILFERHYFRRLTKGVYDVSHSDLSHPVYGGYGKLPQHSRLWRAAMLDEEAALKSASWGRFQIMGEFHKEAGFDSVAGFVWAMMESERRHLDAFVSFIKASSAMLTALRNKDWATFARRYNGPNYRDNQYDTKMANEYARLAPPPPPPPSKKVPAR